MRGEYLRMVIRIHEQALAVSVSVLIGTKMERMDIDSVQGTSSLASSPSSMPMEMDGPKSLERPLRSSWRVSSARPKSISFRLERSQTSYERMGSNW